MSTTQEQVSDALDDRQLPVHEEAVLAEQLMTTAPVCVQPETRAPDIIKMLYTRPFHHLLVVDANGALVGVISDRDVVRCFCRASGSNGTGLAGMTAAEMMSTELETIAPDTTIRGAVELMKDRGISCLPVMAGPKLVGILTDSDLWTLLDSLLGLMEARHANA